MMRWTCVCGAPVWPNCPGLPCTGNQLPKWAGGARTSTGLGPKGGALQTLEEVWELPGKLETLCFPAPNLCWVPQPLLSPPTLHLAVAVGQAPPRVFLLPLIRLDSPERSQLPGQCGLDPRGSPSFGLRGGQV